MWPDIRNFTDQLHARKFAETLGLGIRAAADELEGGLGEARQNLGPDFAAEPGDAVDVRVVVQGPDEESCQLELSVVSEEEALSVGRK